MAQTQTTSGTVAGYFENHADAERAVQDLRDAGFTSAHIGVAHRSGSSLSNAASTVGEKTEGVWDKVKSFFEGGEAEPYAGERREGDLGTREITQDDYRSGSSTDLHQNLAGMSVPEDRSRYFGNKFGSDDNGALVTVNAGERASEAEAILKRDGADLGDNPSSYDASAATSQNIEGVQGTRNIQLLGEILRVHKDRISRGDVTLRKEVITETQTVQVPVTREELVIERRAVDGDTPATGNIGDNSEIRIPLSEETASVDKSTVVREEVTVGKKAVDGVRDLSGEVRHEELVVNDETAKTSNR